MAEKRKTLHSSKKDDVIEWLNAPGNNFCAVPFSHMAIEANGNLRPCCVGLPFADENGQPIRAENLTISELWNHPVRQEFIESFRRNEQHPLCEMCWTQGKFENRLKFSTNISTFPVTQSYMDTGRLPEAKLRWLEIKPGNRCNLACRICGLHNSSRWTKPDWQLKKKVQSETTSIRFADSQQYLHQLECDWIDVTPIWLDCNGLSDIDMIHFMGGEPMMVPEHFQMLENLVNDPDIDTSKIDIRYNTNGTLYPTPEQESILRNFKRVFWLLSIDDTGKRFEYQRYGERWTVVEANIQQFKKNWGSVVLDPTISMLNAFYLDEYIEWADSLGFNINHLGESYHMVASGSNGNKDVRNLPRLTRAVLKDKLSASRYKDIPLLSNTIKWMEVVKDEKLREKEFEYLLRCTQIIDQQRKQDISRDHSRLTSIEPWPWDRDYPLPQHLKHRPI